MSQQTVAPWQLHYSTAHGVDHSSRQAYSQSHAPVYPPSPYSSGSSSSFSAPSPCFTGSPLSSAPSPSSSHHSDGYDDYGSYDASPPSRGTSNFHYTHAPITPMSTAPNRASQRSIHQQPFAELNTYDSYQLAPVSSHSLATAGSFSPVKRGSSTQYTTSQRRKSSSTVSPYPSATSSRSSLSTHGQQHTQSPGPMRTTKVSRSTRGSISHESTSHISTTLGRMPPTNYIKLPQEKYQLPKEPTRGSAQRYRSVQFAEVGFPEAGVRVGKILETEFNRGPNLEGRDEQVIVCPDREIKIHLLWPGYQPFQKRAKTNGGLSTEVVLLHLAKTVCEFAKHVRSLGYVVHPGNDMYAVGTRPDGRRGIDTREVIITALHHRGVSNWQIEVWIPRLARGLQS